MNKVVCVVKLMIGNERVPQREEMEYDRCLHSQATGILPGEKSLRYDVKI